MKKTFTTVSFPNESSFERSISFKWIKKSLIVETISWLLIFLFMYAAITKLLDFEKSRIQIAQSPLLASFPLFVAITIPASEIIISIMLALPRFRLLGLYASFSLMIMFTGYIIAITNFSDYTPCSCGGILEHMTWNQHLVFNIIFVLLPLIAVILKKETNTL